MPSAALESERAVHATLKAQVATQAEEAFIAEAIQAGKVLPGSKLETALRRMYGYDAEAAREQLELSPVVSPVGQARQSASLAADIPRSTVSPTVAKQLSQMGIKDPGAFFESHGPKEDAWQR